MLATGERLVLAASRAARAVGRMTLLRRYIVMSVLRGVGLALAVLVAVMTGFDLVAQLNDIGSATTISAAAIFYVVLGMPRTIFSVLPAAALIGSLLALGNLAVHRELIVMRASGISSWQLLLSVGLAGFALAVLMVLLGESLAPSLSAYADEMRTRAMREDVGTAEGKATWLKDGDHIFSLRRQTGEARLSGRRAPVRARPRPGVAADRARRHGGRRRGRNVGCCRTTARRRFWTTA